MSTDAPASLPDDIEQLRGLLLCERAQSQQQRELHDQTVAQLSQTIQTQQRALEQQEQRIAQLLRWQYGPRQERIDPDQLLLFDQAELEQIAKELRESLAEMASDLPSNPASYAQPESTDAGKKRPVHGRRRLPEHLPREPKLYELSESERRCPCCGETRCEIGRETSEQLEYVPAKYKVIEHIRVKYACKACQENVAIAAKPPQPIEKGLPGPGLIAQTVLGKFGDHVPLYRQEDQAARHGITIRRSTLCDWLAAAADLALPLYARMITLILQSHNIHTDDTTVKLLVPLLGRAQIARFWAYLGDRQHPYTVYDFTESRSRDGPAKFLQGYRGYLQADAYGGYDGIYTGSRGAILEVACWAHARRYWWEARTSDPPRAHHALGAIARLYQIESQLAACCAKLVPEQRASRIAEGRQEHALPILKTLRTWLDEQAPRLLPKSPLGQAATYTLNQWDALVRYTEDGELSIDNNISERTVKMQAIGRKNWLFVASPAGGRRAAILYSLVASCKANQVEPWAYLCDLFTRLPSIAAAQPEWLDELLPDRWLVSHPQQRWDIDKIRRAERQQRKQTLRAHRK